MTFGRSTSAVLLLVTLSGSSWMAADQGAPGRAGGAARPGSGQQTPPRDRLPQTAAATASVTGTGTISGRVTSLEGTPVRRAQIQLTAADANVRKSASTDGDGRFTFTDLPAGSYTIRASRNGYVSFAYGQRELNGTVPPVILGDGESLTALSIVLPRGSAITGRVTDEFGDPVLQAQVQALRYQYQADGTRRLVQGGQMAMTDDLGQFRLFGLTPGEYVVSAQARDVRMTNGAPGGFNGPQNIQVADQDEGYAPTFYPGTGNPAEAQPLNVGLSQELSVQLQLVPSRLSRLTGIVVDSQGRPAGQGTPVTLRPVMQTGIVTVRPANLEIDGSFTITGVPAGEYILEVRPRPVFRPNDTAPQPDGEFAFVPISVGGGDITGIRIVTGKGSTLSGRVVFEGSPPPAGTRIRVVPQAVDSSRQVQVQGPGRGGNSTDGVVGSDGSFRLAGISAPIFLRITFDNLPAGRGGASPPGQLPFMTKSVVVDGVDVADVPLDPTRRGSITGITLVVTDKLTDISGSVTDSRGTPLDSTTVLIVPEGLPSGVSPTRFVKMVQTSGSGKFNLRGLPAGRYAAVAVSRFDQAHQFDPDVLQRARQLGKSFSVDEGERLTLDLRLTDDF